MISSLRGKINRVWGNKVEIEVNGVGYLVGVGRRFLLKHTEGEDLKLHTFMAVSENDIRLFGFESWEEVELFSSLLDVSGVGPKTAAQILGEKEVGEIIRAIGEADVDFFKKIKGIGQKAAQKIIIELKSKIGGLGVLDLKKEAEMEEDDLYMSLKQLGFARKEIDVVVKKMPKELAELEERLSWCLHNLG